MGGTGSPPGQDGVMGLLRRKGGQVLVRYEQDGLVRRQAFNHLHRVGGGAADFAEGLDAGRGVHIGHHLVFRMLCQKGLYPGFQGIVEHPAPGIDGRQQGNFVRRKDVGGFCHEPDPAEHDHVRIGLGRLLGQGKRIPAEISDFLDFLRLVYMGQDHRIPFLFQAGDGIEQVFHGSGLLLGKGELSVSLSYFVYIIHDFSFIVMSADVSR